MILYKIKMAWIYINFERLCLSGSAWLSNREISGNAISTLIFSWVPYCPVFWLPTDQWRLPACGLSLSFRCDRSSRSPAFSRAWRAPPFLQHLLNILASLYILILSVTIKWLAAMDLFLNRIIPSPRYNRQNFDRPESRMVTRELS